MWKRLLTTIGVVTLTVTACGGDPITSGIVIDRQHDREYSILVQMPVYTTRCSGSGTTRTCFTSVSSWIPTYQHHDEAWRLKVRDDVEQTRTQWITVSEAAYEAHPGGSHWQIDNTH